MTNDLHDIIRQIMIRNMSTIIAYELIDGKSRAMGWRRRSSGEYLIYKAEIVDWIRSHDSALWADAATLDFTLAFVFTEEMEVLFLLRWA